MSIPISQPLEPMEAQLVDVVPNGKEWQYEPKWDGFRCIAFRDGKRLELQSKSGQSLTRYFPELVAALLKLPAKQFVLDGEIVIPVGQRLSFDDLLQRIHPAQSRVLKLSQLHPAWMVVFDLLVDARGNPLLDKPLKHRRRELERFAKAFDECESLWISPATLDVKVARRWFRGAGGSTDGVIAKRLDLPYEAGERTGMQKVKPIHSVDCVVGGFRYAEGKKIVGSLLLGLYDDQGLLNHVGFTSALSEVERQRLTPKLVKRIKPPGFTGNKPGGPSRWSTKRSSEWQPLKPDLVVEVSYDHFTGERFRHGTGLLRWRPDKAAAQCTIDQIEQGGTSLRLLHS